MARPKTYDDGTKVRLHPSGKSKLQESSDRRAIVDLIVDNKGVMTMGEIDEHFGFDIRPKVIALMRSNWLEVVE